MKSSPIVDKLLGNDCFSRLTKRRFRRSVFEFSFQALSRLVLDRHILDLESYIALRRLNFAGGVLIEYADDSDIPNDIHGTSLIIRNLGEASNDFRDIGRKKTLSNPLMRLFLISIEYNAQTSDPPSILWAT